MQGYQFGHVETWSRKGRARHNGNEHAKRRNGQRAWTVEQILEEAERAPWASRHVGFDKRPATTIAGTCADFDELRDAHDDACSVKLESSYRNRKTGRTSKRKKSVRVDAHTLYTSVISLPVDSKDAEADPELRPTCQRIFGAAVAFEKERLEAAGGEFAMAAIHRDERKLHIHIFGVDRTHGSVNGLHPGKAAADELRRRNDWKSVPKTELDRAYWISPGSVDGYPVADRNCFCALLSNVIGDL